MSQMTSCLGFVSVLRATSYLLTSSHSLSISALGVLKKARAKIERHFSAEYTQVNDYAVIKTQLLRN